MIGRETMLRVLQGEHTESIPVTPHWWGLYKFEFAKLIHGYDHAAEAWSMNGIALAEIDGKFYEEFRPDMLHLTVGGSLVSESEAIIQEKRRLKEAVYRLESYRVIDEYVEAVFPAEDDLRRSGIFDHISLLAQKYGKETVLMFHEGNPVSWILDPYGCLGFENGLIAMLEKPDMVEYLLYRSYRAMLPMMRMLKKMGADGYIGSETYCSTDIMSPALYRSVVFGAQQEFYKGLRQLGLIAGTYFLGNINPLLPDIKQLGAQFLMVEEGKKNFTLDIGEIYRQLEGELCLFGNLDSVYTLQRGSKEEVINETKRQIEACSKGHFVMSNGCPLSFSTPPENIQAMIQTVRSRN